MQLVLCEIPVREDSDGRDVGDAGEGEEGEGEGERRERDPWSEQVPLLNGSVRFGGEQRVWAGRTVEIRRVAGRWFGVGEVDGGPGVEGGGRSDEMNT